MRNFSLKYKITFAVMLICIVLSALSVFTLYRNNSSTQKYQKISSDNFPKVMLLGDILANFRGIRIEVRSLPLPGNTGDDKKRHMKNAAQYIKNVEKSLTKLLGDYSFDDTGKMYNAQISKHIGIFKKFGQEIFDLYNSGVQKNIDKANERIRMECPVKAKKVIAPLEEFLSHQVKRNRSLVAKANSMQKQTLKITAIFIACCFLFSILFGVLFSRSISKKISDTIASLTNNYKSVDGSSKSLLSQSFDLKKSSDNASKTLKHAIKTITEITEMLRKSTELAKKSEKTATESNLVAREGSKSVELMTSSIEDISKIVQEISKEIQNNGENLSKIVEVISNINEKTTVINDIVFQTKLLSFNASVEAARAGEHGKGFSVVAEEVGNLASMSGKAAEEITVMLENSKKQVEDIVHTTEKNMTSLSQKSQITVENGKQVAKNCKDSLNEIHKKITSVSEMVKQISIASIEQSAGIDDFTNHMRTIDTVINENTSSAKKSTSEAETLKDRANDLNSDISSLLHIVNGDKAA